MESPFMTIEDIDQTRTDVLLERDKIRKDRIDFEFPEGFKDIPPIEQARALQCWDWPTNTASFDMWYDVMKQLLTEKPVRVMFKNEQGNFEEIFSFIITDRYMDFNGIEWFREYPIILNWLVAKVAYELEKKFPRSLADIQSLKTRISELMSMKLDQEKKMKERMGMTK